MENPFITTQSRRKSHFVCSRTVPGVSLARTIPAWSVRFSIHGYPFCAMDRDVNVAYPLRFCLCCSAAARGQGLSIGGHRQSQSRLCLFQRSLFGYHPTAKGVLRKIVSRLYKGRRSQKKKYYLRKNIRKRSTCLFLQYFLSANLPTQAAPSIFLSQ